MEIGQSCRNVNICLVSAGVVFQGTLKGSGVHIIALSVKVCIEAWGGGGGGEKTRPQTCADISTYINRGAIMIYVHPLRMHCHTCSLVTSSGHLIGGGRGEEIDGAECVIRMNDAPTAGAYGRNVGRRTSLRVIAHSSMQRVLRSRHELLNASQDAVFIFWGPSNYMRRDGKGLVYNNLRMMNQVLPKLKVYIISWQKMQQFDELFKKETGKDRKISNSWLSTGWFTMTIALELCDRIDVYGMVAPDFCRTAHRILMHKHVHLLQPNIFTLRMRKQEQL
uniref:ST6 N-acetylgalactosaminide alpha-2,6-sialyltransferase 5 n=1 Tax=Fundulus heteroclitus TaxID=8078 RepID=A0A3Q2ULW7_FUNHE